VVLPLAEIKRTEGSHSAEGNTAGHALRDTQVRGGPIATRSPLNLHFYSDRPAYKQTISIATVAPANAVISPTS
jgi:hypothetical protein